MSAGAAAFLLEAFEPRIPVGDDFLDLFGRHVLVPIRAAEEEEVVNFFCAHGVMGWRWVIILKALVTQEMA